MQESGCGFDSGGQKLFCLLFFVKIMKDFCFYLTKSTAHVMFVDLMNDKFGFWFSSLFWWNFKWNYSLFLFLLNASGDDRKLTLEKENELA